MNAAQISGWGAIATSLITMVTFLGALVASFFMRDPGLLNLAIGAAIANATTVVNFWLGSSSGSQKKDDTIARQAGNAGAAVVSSPGTDDTIAVAVGAAAIDAGAQPAQR